MAEVPRISPSEAREGVLAGTMLLVCAYQSDEKFRNNHLEGAIPFSEFEAKAPQLEKDKPIVFYCA